MQTITLSALVPSLIRTYVPVAIGSALSLLVTVGVIPTPLPADQEAAVVTAIVAITIGGYYTILRLAERRWPAIGVLLGSTRQPEYVDGRTDDARHRDDGDGTDEYGTHRVRQG